MAGRYRFGTRIKKYREEKGISQSEFAEGIEKTVSVVYGYETNQIVPSYDTVSKMATVLGVDIGELLDLERSHGMTDEELYQLAAKMWQEQFDEENGFN